MADYMDCTVLARPGEEGARGNTPKCMIWAGCQ